MKKVIAIILAACIMLFLIPSASAYDHLLSKDFVPWDYQPKTLDDNHTLAEKVRELYRYCDSLFTYFNYFPEDFSGFIDPVEDNVSLYFSGDFEPLDAAVRRVYNEVYKYSGKDFVETATDEFFRSYYDELKEASKVPQVSYYEIEFLVKICAKEDNSSGFYSSEVWEPFAAALDNAIEACDKYNNSRIYSDPDEGNSDIYWDLYFAYNKLCMQLSVPGDANGDGEADIVDVTYLQRQLTGGAVRLTAAQRCVSCVNVNYSRGGASELYPDMIDVTYLQRYHTRMYDSLFDRTMKPENDGLIYFLANPIIAYEYNARIFPWYYNPWYYN